MLRISCVWLYNDTIEVETLVLASLASSASMFLSRYSATSSKPKIKLCKKMPSRIQFPSQMRSRTTSMWMIPKSSILNTIMDLLKMMWEGRWHVSVHGQPAWQ